MFEGRGDNRSSAVKFVTGRFATKVHGCRHKLYGIEREEAVVLVEDRVGDARIRGDESI